MSYTCPCCGFYGLELIPYEMMVSPVVDDSIRPPYSRHFGNPSYEVCACCGFEFGNDDDPGTAPPVTFKEYLNEWINDGKEWFDDSRKPENWNLEEQLKHAGLQD